MIMLERSKFGKWLQTLWAPFQCAYALLIVMIGWVFFRSENLPHALYYLKAMFGGATFYQMLPYSVAPRLNSYVGFAFLSGALFSVPAFPQVKTLFTEQKNIDLKMIVGFVSRDILLISLLILALTFMAHSTHQAYIYLRF
jgi:alginate O-acetyltransferase complex protein AlgI